MSQSVPNSPTPPTPLTSQQDMSLPAYSVTPTTDQMEVGSAYTIPWRSGLRAGHGVDGVTGADRAMAVKPFTASPLTGDGSAGEIKQYLHLCSNSDSMRDTFRRITSVEGALNFEPLDLHGSIKDSALSHVQCSSRSFSLVAQWKCTLVTEGLPNAKHELEKAAYDELLADRELFRQKYGDYFVCGYRRGSQFDAVLTFEYGDAAGRDHAVKQLNLGGELQSKYFNANADLTSDLQRLSSAFTDSVSASMHISMRGVKTEGGQEKTFEMKGLKDGAPVLDSLASFTKRLAPEHVSAELRGYSLIQNIPVGAICKNLPVSIDAFTDLSKIRMQILACRIAAMSLSPMHHDPDLRTRLERLVADCQNRRSTLPSDKQHRTRVLDLATELNEDYIHLSAASELWTEIEESYALDRETYEQPRAGKWTAGLQRDQIQKPIKMAVKKESFTIKMELKNMLGRSYRRIEASDFSAEQRGPSQPPDENSSASAMVERIVGWRVILVQGDGELKVLRDHAGLFEPWKDDPLFALSSAKFFGATVKWEVKVYVVVDKYFEVFAQHQPSSGFRGH